MERDRELAQDDYLFARKAQGLAAGWRQSEEEVGIELGAGSG